VCYPYVDQTANAPDRIAAELAAEPRRGLRRLTAAVPPEEAADLSGLVNTSAQVAAVAGVAAYGTVYFALAGRPGFAFGAVVAALAASGLAAAACSFLSARRGTGAAGQAAVPAEERVPARLAR
jgi:hypothetical protein